MDTLDFNDPYYDREALDLQLRYDEQYELIEDMESQLAKIQGQIDDIHQEKITADNIYHLLLAFDEVYNAATEVAFSDDLIRNHPRENAQAAILSGVIFAYATSG